MTFVLSNYGTFFQHYALRKVLAEMGWMPVRWRHYCDEALGTVGWICERVKHVLWWIRWMLRLPDGFENVRRELFLNDRLTGQFRKSYRRLIGPLQEENRVGDGDICVLGSDQILSQPKAAWFADAPKEARRIVYAGSCDWKKVGADEDWKTMARELLPRFSAVSVREQAGVELLQTLIDGGRPVFRAVDPVLLLTRKALEQIAAPKKIFTKPTLFCYFVNIRKDEDLPTEKMEVLARELGCELRMLGIQGAMGRIPQQYRLILSPEEFLSAYRDAAYIVTNSFHGTVFALQFGKSFISLRQSDSPGADQNARQRELLSGLGLEDYRMNVSAAIGEMQNRLVRSVDWLRVDSLLNQSRSRSLLRLKKDVQNG